MTKCKFQYILLLLYSLSIVSLHSCRNVTHDDMIGCWRESNDSITLFLYDDSSFVEMINPRTSKTRNAQSDTTLILKGLWSFNVNNGRVELIYQEWDSCFKDFQLMTDWLEVYDMFFYIELLYWNPSMDDFYILKKNTDLN